jgi:hypothetical protein
MESILRDLFGDWWQAFLDTKSIFDIKEEFQWYEAFKNVSAVDEYKQICFCILEKFDDNVD